MNQHHLTTAGINESRAEIVAQFDAELAAGNFARALLVIAEQLDTHADVLALRAQHAPARYRAASERGLAAARASRVEMLERWTVAHAAATGAADAA